MTDFPNGPLPPASALRARILAMLEPPEDFMPPDFTTIKDFRDGLQDAFRINMKPHTETLNELICDLKMKDAVKVALDDRARAAATAAHQVAKRERDVAERLRAFERLFERETRVAEGERRHALRERQLHERERQLEERWRRRPREEGDDSSATEGGGAPTLSAPPEWSDGIVARVSIVTPEGPFYVSLNTLISVDALKATFEHIVGIPKADQRIEVGGTCLDDAAAVIRDRGVVEYATVHLTYLTAAPRSSVFPIHVKELDGSSFKINIAKNTRVEHVKFLVWLRRGIPPRQQRLIFTAKQLEAGRTIAEYGIFSPDSVVHLVVNDATLALGPQLK